MGSKLLRHRFKLLLVTLIAVILISPLIVDSIARTSPGATRSVLFGFTVSLLFAGAMVIRGERVAKGAFLAVVFASILLDAAAAFIWPGQIEFWDHGLRILFLGFLIVELMRHLFLPEVVNFDTLCASLCVYLLIGLMWMNIYVVLETVVPQSIASTSETDRQGADGELPISIEMLYFSFTTLTTVGYGDFVPRTNFARMLAVTEALVGQCYLLVMVSRLVGLHVAQEFPGGTGPPAPPAGATEDDTSSPRTSA